MERQLSKTTGTEIDGRVCVFVCVRMCGSDGSPGTWPGRTTECSVQHQKAPTLLGETFYGVSSRKSIIVATYEF